MDDFNRILKLSEIAHLQSDYDKEIKCLENALLLNIDQRDRALTYQKIGVCLYLLNKNTEAKTNFFKALELVSGLTENNSQKIKCTVNEYLGSIFHDENDYEKALLHKMTALQFIESLDKENAFMLLVAIGVNHEKLENFDNAITFYNKALDIQDILDEDRAMAFQFLGQCFDKKGDDKNAFDNFEKLFIADPDYDGSWYLFFRFAQLAYRFRRFAISKKYFKIVIHRIPADQKSYLLSSIQCLGYIYIENHEYKRALTEFKKAIKIMSEPSKLRAEVFCGMAQAYFGLNKIRNTIKFSLKAIEEEPDIITEERIYFLLAYSYSLRSNSRKEKFYIEKLEKVNPNSGYLRELL